MKISVIIPVRNEESLIVNQIERLRSSAGLYPTEILVVDGGSTDRTVELSQPLADQVLVSPVAGRGAQCDFGARQASGEILLFLHVDTQLPPQWQKVLADNLRDGTVAGAFRLQFDSESLFYRITAALAHWRSFLTGVPHGDQALAVSQSAYRESGGYPHVPLMEEYLFIPKLKKLGGVRIFKESVITSARRYAKKGPLRNALLNNLFIFLFYCGVSQRRIARWYYPSHSSESTPKLV